MVQPATTCEDGRTGKARVVPQVDLHGVKFLGMSEAECVRHVLERCDAGEGGWIVTPNIDILRQCARDPSIREMVGRADVVVADGMPLVWASILQGTPLPERVAGSTLISSVAEAAAQRGRSVYFLGGAQGTASSAAAILGQRFPGLRVIGSYCPPFGFEKDRHQIDRMADAVRAAAPDIVFVALSFPKGEHLIEQIRYVLPSTWWVGVGVSFSFICGDVQRAPRWMQTVGLEWLHRLAQEPGRLAKRYLVHGIPFAVELLAGAALKRIVGR